MKITRKKIDAAVGPDINTSDNPYADSARYAEEFCEGVAETLLDSYGLRTRYRMTGDGLTFIIMNPEEKGSSATKTYFWEDLDLCPEDMEEDVMTAAEEIALHIVGVYAATDIPDKEDIYAKTESFRDSEEYKRLAEYDYTLDLLDNGCVIRFSDGDPYATFKFVPADLSEFEGSETWTPEDIKRYGLDEWLVYADGDMINERIDYPPTNYDDAVLTAIRYFWSHY